MFYWLHTLYCKKRAKLMFAVALFQKFSFQVKDAEASTPKKLLTVLVSLVDGREGYRGEAVSYPVIHDDCARDWFFHVLSLLVLKTKPGHIRN